MAAEPRTVLRLGVAWQEDAVAAGSAFHELGFPDADALVVKARLIRSVADEIRRRNLTLQETCDLFGLAPPAASAVLNEKPSRISLQDVMRLAHHPALHPPSHPARPA